MVAFSPTDGEGSMPQSTPWVLLVLTGARKRRHVRKWLEQAGCGVEVVSGVEDALECLNVMKPTMIVLDDDLALPGTGDLLNRARAVGVDTARRRDVVGKQLAAHGQRDGGQLFRKA